MGYSETYPNRENSGKDIGYAVQLTDDLAFRSEWCERAGLGFQLVNDGTQNVVSIDAVKVA